MPSRNLLPSNPPKLPFLSVSGPSASSSPPHSPTLKATTTLTAAAAAMANLPPLAPELESEAERMEDLTARKEAKASRNRGGGSRARGRKQGRSQSQFGPGGGPDDAVNAIISRLSSQVRALEEREARRDQREARMEKKIEEQRDKILSLIKEIEDIKEHFTLFLDWAETISASAESYPLTNIRLRSLLDAAQARLAAAAALPCGSTIFSASLQWRERLSAGEDRSLPIHLQDAKRLAIALDILDADAERRDPAIIILKNSPEAMRLLTQSISAIRNRGNVAAHHVNSNAGVMHELINAPVAALGASEKRVTLSDYLPPWTFIYATCYFNSLVTF
ncbi:hypothetical protein BJ912DRAFT_1071769 [Pholiota molesta]|nr:hypothetical protein BJ912DRAFT_1071769 [Pholiota molesta]